MCCENIEPLLSAFVDGALDDGEQRKVKEHLADCEACAAEERLLRELSREVGALPSVKAPPGFANSLHEKLDAHDAQLSQSIRSVSYFRFKRPLWFGVAASFILAGVTIAFLIVSQIKMQSLTENSMAGPNRQVADHTPPAPLDSEIVSRLKSLGYVSAPAGKTAGKTDGASGPSAPKRRNKESPGGKKGPRAEFVSSGDEDLPAGSRSFEDDFLGSVAIEKPEDSLFEEIHGSEPESEMAEIESVERIPGAAGETEGKVVRAADSDLILVVDTEEWRMPKHLVAMANSTGPGIMDFSAQINLPRKKNETFATREKRKQGKRGKGPGKGPGRGDAVRSKVEEVSDKKADQASFEMKDETGREWVCVYVDAEMEAIPELLEDLALTPEANIWQGSFVPQTEAVDEVEGMGTKPFAGYELSVSRIPWIDDLLAKGGVRSVPDTGSVTMDKEAAEPPHVHDKLERTKENRQGMGTQTQRRKILIIFPKRALEKENAKE